MSFEPGSGYCWRWQPGASLGDPEPDTRGQRGLRVPGRTRSNTRDTFSLICVFNTRLVIIFVFAPSSRLKLLFEDGHQFNVSSQINVRREYRFRIVVRHLLTRYLKFLDFSINSLSRLRSPSHPPGPGQWRPGDRQPPPGPRHPWLGAGARLHRHGRLPPARHPLVQGPHATRVSSTSQFWLSLDLSEHSAGSGHIKYWWLV